MLIPESLSSYADWEALGKNMDALEAIQDILSPIEADADPELPRHIGALMEVCVDALRDKVNLLDAAFFPKSLCRKDLATIFEALKRDVELEERFRRERAAKREAEQKLYDRTVAAIEKTCKAA